MVNAKRCMCGLCGKMVKCRLIRGRTVDKYVDNVDNYIFEAIICIKKTKNKAPKTFLYTQRNNTPPKYGISSA